MRAPDINQVQTFFNTVARDYQSVSDGWPWRWLRSKETKAVRRQLGELGGKTVLDMGSGAGYYTRMALQVGAKHVVAVDICQNMIEALPTNSVTGIVGDASDVSLDRPFETMIIAGLLEFAATPSAIFVNARKHAMEEAKLAVLAPLDNVFGRLYRAYHLSHGIRISLFTRGSIVEMGEKAGWESVSGETVWPFSIVLGFRAVS